MVAKKGSKVTIAGIGGMLAEDVNISLKSTFRTLYSPPSNAITQGLDLAGATLDHVTGGAVGFSSQFKQFTTQVWDRTDPAAFNLNVDYFRTFDGSDSSIPKDIGLSTEVSGENVMKIVRRLCAIPLPRENKGGNLVAPGPSVIEGIGLNQLKSADDDKWDGSGIVSVVVGSMKFHRLIMTGAEPTFNKYVDDSGYPISCRIAFQFVSLWAATKGVIGGW